MWILPEGTLIKDLRLHVFKKGFVHAALATKLPIIPVVVHNAAKIFPRGPLKFEPGPLDIEVLDAVPTTDWTAETLEQHVQDIRDIIVHKLEEGPPVGTN